MPIDPNISLRVETPHTMSFADLMKGRLAVQSAIQQRDSNRAAMELNQVRSDQERLDNDLKRTQIARQKEDDADDDVYHETLAASPDTDWKTVRSQLATKVKPRNLVRYDADAQKAAQTWNSLDAEKRKKVVEDNKSIGDALIGISVLPDAQRQPAWTSAKAQFEQAGIIQPGAYPDQVPDTKGLESLIAKHGAYTNYLGTVQKKAATDLTESKQKAEDLKAARAEITDLKGEFFQGLVSKGKDLTDEEYQARLADKKYDKIREDLPPTLTNAKTGRTAEHTMEAIRRSALTAAQMGTEADKAVDDARQAARDASLERTERIRANTAQIRAEIARGNNGKMSAGDTRAFRKDMEDAGKEESKIRETRAAIETALVRGGNTYVGKNGQPVAMTKALGEASDATKDSLIADMKTRYKALGEDLKRVVHDKYLAGEALQVKPSTGKDEVLAGIDADEARVLSGQQKTGTAVATGSAAPAVAAAPPTVAKFETPLNTAEEAKFQEWKKKNAPNDSGEDYDLRGAFKADLAGKLPRDARNHTSDEHKKPNHPSFSQDSKFSGKDGNVGGRWAEENGQTVFYASPTNLKYNSPDELKAYFKREEPNVKLVLPGAKPAATSAVQVDSSVTEKGGYKVGGEYETKDGRKFTLKGFTKDGKMVPEFK